MIKIDSSYLRWRFIFYIALSFFIPTSSFADLGITAPTFTSKAWILIDYNTGKILTKYHPDLRLNPASLTKMMTSYVIGQALKNGKINLHAIVNIPKDACATNYSKLKNSSLMFIKPLDRITVSDLNKGIIIQSGNDACIALADYIAGSQIDFIKKMNNYTKVLGLTSTHFMTVHGLDAINQYTTAKEIALIGQSLIRDLPEEYLLHKEKQFVFNHITQYNRNRLLWKNNLNVDGIKTGHTSESGYNLVASATKDNMRLISVLLGSSNSDIRFTETEKLLHWGFKYFENIQLIKGYHPFISHTIFFGNKKEVLLGVKKDANIVIPKGQRQFIKEKIKFFYPKFKAPLHKNKIVGIMIIQLNEQTVQEFPIISLENIRSGGVFKHLKDIFLSFFNLFTKKVPYHYI
ncbi:serine hydrolase [Candidatus Ishikawella capsulata]|nr:serine hydrolase [Candidatus Ishikawaella capsulata]